MQYSKEVMEMCCVKKGCDHGPAPIPEEGKWVGAKEIKDISGLSHGVGACAPQQGACKLTLNIKEGIIKEEELPPPPAVETKSATVTVQQTRIVTLSGESWAYFYGSDGFVYKKMIREDESVLLIEDKAVYTFAYTETANAKIRQLVSWSYDVGGK